jgi:hypothetical protein
MNKVEVYSWFYGRKMTNHSILDNSIDPCRIVAQCRCNRCKTTFLKEITKPEEVKEFKEKYKDKKLY